MHAVLLTVALLVVLCLPVAVAALICADDLVDHLARRLAGRREIRYHRRTINQLDRVFEADSLARDIDLTEFDRVSRPAIERIAADLRRLRAQRVGVGSRSPLWHGVVLQAYDEQLRLASRCLGVAEHLDELHGIDLEIERVRVEGALQAAGLILPNPDGEPRRATG